MENPNRLITLGTGCGFASSRRNGPGHLIISDNHCLLLDCGEGVTGALRCAGRLLDVEAVYISHLHPDHISGFLPLIQNNMLLERRNELHFHLPAPGISAFIAMRDAAYLNPETKLFESFTTSFHPIETGTYPITEKLILRVWESDHFSQDRIRENPQRPAFGFTIDAVDARLVYTADVNTIECFESHLNNKTTLLCEAMHIDPRELISTAFNRGVRRIIFTHADPSAERELKRFCAENRNISVAEDLNKFDW